MRRRNWWPIGHHLLSEASIDQSSFQARLNAAERDADRTQDLLEVAHSAGAGLDELETLAQEAIKARHRYYAALNTDLAL